MLVVYLHSYLTEATEGTPRRTQVGFLVPLRRPNHPAIALDMPLSLPVRVHIKGSKSLGERHSSTKDTLATGQEARGIISLERSYSYILSISVWLGRRAS